MAEENEMVVEETKSSNMPMILVGVLTLVIGAVGGLFASDFMSDDAATEETTSTAEEISTASDGTVSVANATTIVTPLGDFSINLKEAATLRILQMSISVECEPSVEATVIEDTPQIRNAILMFTSEYTVNSLTGLEGKMDLRDEIQLRINAIIKPHRVERVYFTKFIIGK